MLLERDIEREKDPNSTKNSQIALGNRLIYRIGQLTDIRVEIVFGGWGIIGNSLTEDGAEWRSAYGLLRDRLGISEN